MQETIESAPEVAEELVDRAEVKDGQPIVKYSHTEAELAALRVKYKDAKYDLTTTAGNQAARAGRLELVNLRGRLEDKRKAFKAPALEFGRTIDAEAARIKGEILALEDPIDAQIKADEKRRDDERRAKEEAEAARKKVHTDAIAKLAGYVAQAADLGAERLAKGIQMLEGFDLSGFEEYTAEATETRDRTLAALRALHVKAVAREAEEARLVAERAEQARIAAEQAETARKLKAEQEELERQRAALAAERKAAEEAREAEERRQKAAAAEAERQRIAAEAAAQVEQERQAEIARRREEANAAGSAAMEAISEARQAEDLPAPLIDALEQVASGLITDLAMGRAADAAKPAAGPAVIPMPTRAPAAQPSLRLGQINQLIAPLQITADGLTSLGFPPAGKDGAARLYFHSDLPRIRAALVAHLQAVQLQEAA